MRLKIDFLSDKKYCLFPYNYNYELSSICYKMFRSSNSMYADFLHQYGYLYENKNFKFFTFSRLNFNKANYTKDGIIILDRKIRLFFSSPVDNSISNFLIGILKHEKIEFFVKGANISLIPKSIDEVPEVNIKNEMYFKCLSPIYIDVIKEDKKTGKLIKNHVPEYPEENEEFVRLIKNNLIKKYRAFYRQDIEPEEFEFEFDKEYIYKQKEKGKRISSMIKMNKDGRIINLKCYNIPFRIKTSPALIKLGYETGFGCKNSLGFGCVEVVKNKS